MRVPLWAFCCLFATLLFTKCDSKLIHMLFATCRRLLATRVLPSAPPFTAFMLFCDLPLATCNTSNYPSYAVVSPILRFAPPGTPLPAMPHDDRLAIGLSPAHPLRALTCSNFATHLIRRTAHPAYKYSVTVFPSECHHEGP